jgi:hypothetical protein
LDTTCIERKQRSGRIELKAIIPEGSTEWNILKGAFFSLLPRETSSEREVGPLAKEGVVDFRTLELFPRLRLDLIAAAADPCTVLQRISWQRST